MLYLGKKENIGIFLFNFFMAKNKKSEVPHYELLYIISNQFTEEEVEKINGTVKKLIEDNSGKITFSEVWGKKKFCYKINNFSHGYYNLYEFDCDAEKIQKINQELRLSHEVLRHMLITKPKRTLEEIEEEKRISLESVQKEAKEAQAEIKKNEESEEKKEIKKPAKKVDSKELDAKLDKILETDDLL